MHDDKRKKFQIISEQLYVKVDHQNEDNNSTNLKENQNDDKIFPFIITVSIVVRLFEYTLNKFQYNNITIKKEEKLKIICGAIHVFEITINNYPFQNGN